jgi:hypothetical protein
MELPMHTFDLQPLLSIVAGHIDLLKAVPILMAVFVAVGAIIVARDWKKEPKSRSEKEDAALQRLCRQFMAETKDGNNVIDDCNQTIEAKHDEIERLLGHGQAPELYVKRMTELGTLSETIAQQADRWKRDIDQGAELVAKKAVRPAEACLKDAKERLDAIIRTCDRVRALEVVRPGEEPYRKNEHFDDNEHRAKVRQFASFADSYFADCETQDDLRKAYRTLSKRYHPDNGGDKDMFAGLTEAYQNARKNLDGGVYKQ